MKKLVVRFKGGLGNQLFQYAAGYALARKYRLPLYFDDSSLVIHHPSNTSRRFQLGDLSIKYPFVNIFHKLSYLLLSIFSKNSLVNDLNFKTYKYGNNSLILNGFFQDHNIFSSYRNDIISSIKIITNNPNFSLLSQTISGTKNSVAIHFRRGDYVTNPAANAFHRTISLDYYSSALKILHENHMVDKIFVFSDDIEWVKNNFITEFKIIFIDEKFMLTDPESLVLMSLCKFFIIANSSFSWWAAYLGSNPQKLVFYPKSWNINNMAPKSPSDWTCL